MLGGDSTPAMAVSRFWELKKERLHWHLRWVGLHVPIPGRLACCRLAAEFPIPYRVISQDHWLRLHTHFLISNLIKGRDVATHCGIPLVDIGYGYIHSFGGDQPQIDFSLLFSSWLPAFLFPAAARSRKVQKYSIYNLTIKK